MPIRVPCIVLFLCALAAGCGGAATELSDPATTQAPAPAAVEEADEAAPVERQTPVTVADDASELELGRTVLATPSRQARRTNREALALHRAGDYEAALAGFDEAIAASPGYPVARFNRVCALSRLERYGEASAEMLQLVNEDPVDMKRRFEQDEDLPGLRASEHGAAIQARLERLAPLYAEVIGRGVPALTFERMPDPQRYTHQPYRAVRAGFYDPQTRRFVAVTPSVPNVLAAQVDASADRAILVTGEIGLATCGIWRPSLDSLHVYRPSALGADVATMPPPRLSGEADADSMVFNVTDTGFDVTAYEVLRTSFHVTSDGERRASQPTPRRVSSLVVNSQGNSVPALAPEGYRVTGHRLHRPDGAPIEISRGHFRPDLFLSPDGTRLLAVSVRTGCVDGEPVDERFVADLIDLGAGTNTLVARGRWPGIATGRFAPDGTLFFQLGRTMQRYPAGSDQAIEDVPEGVLLATPLMSPRGFTSCDC